jgi:short-subunit dehydrogenase
MKKEILRGRRALITGASSGLGAEFARVLAEAGCHVALVARRREQLEQRAATLAAQYPIQADVFALDLTEPGAPQDLFDRLQADGKPIDVLINNAGYGMFGEFKDFPWEREKNMLELDVLAVTHMTKLFLRGMLDREFGYILNVSSIGAYQATPLYASYAAAKSYVLLFSEALSYELRKTNVKVTALSPGVTATEFLSVAGQKPTLYQRLMMMKSEDVARVGIDKMLSGRPSVVPGRLNSLVAWSNRLMPRRLSAAVAYSLMKSEA